jgi:phosphate transport system permease protein
MAFNLFSYRMTPRDRANLKTRHQSSLWWRRVFFLATSIGIISLAALLFNILNESFGYVVIVNKVDPSTIIAKPVADWTKTEMIQTLQKSLTRGELARLDKDKAFELRDSKDLRSLLIEKIIRPEVKESYTLIESLTRRGEIEQTRMDKYPGGVLQFRSWLSLDLLTNSMASRPENAGVRTALFGSLWMILIAMVFAFPVGVCAAIYLEEYTSNNWFNRLIQTNIDNLAGVPSIVYGILGLAIFVRALSILTSGQVFGLEGSNGRTLVSAGLTMGLLVLPLMIINTQEAIRAVPVSLKQASYGLGATQWQTIWHHVLPTAFPGILTGTILAVSRAIGETAPLIIVGASTLITTDPSGPFSQFTVLPIQIYNWITRPQDEYHRLAAAAILVLLISLLSLNAGAILLRNRFSRRNA